mmetsp:Transcript_21934/g.31783  ORF Transcript_21934/g.31783 Transcript_21934/m.31783 type:complete len:360 (+) Transcript_21934:62-1141(+)
MKLSRKEALAVCFTAIILHWYEVWSTSNNNRKVVSHVQPEKISYVLLAVSGTLEEGFELRENLDYRPHKSNNVGRVNATFLGKALVRGYKSFLDVKNPSWREYKTEGFKTVNPAIVPTGCYEHANRYSIYAVDSRQAILALAGEPRFLSIAPDMGLADLTAADDLTFPAIKKLVAAFSKLSGGERPPTEVAFLTVTSTWLKSTFVPNEVIRRDKDGIITDFHESTAIWSTSILNKKGPHARFPEGCGSNPSGGQVRNVDYAEDYSECIDAAIRLQESDYTVENGEQLGDFTDFEFCTETATKACFPCQSKARYGVDKDTERFNKVLEACELEELIVQAGVTINDGRPRFRLQGCAFPKI